MKTTFIYDDFMQHKPKPPFILFYYCSNKQVILHHYAMMFDGVAVHGFVVFSHEYKSMLKKGKI